MLANASVVLAGPGWVGSFRGYVCDIIDPDPGVDNMTGFDCELDVSGDTASWQWADGDSACPVCGPVSCSNDVGAGFESVACGTGCGSCPDGAWTRPWDGKKDISACLYNQAIYSGRWKDTTSATWGNWYTSSDGVTCAYEFFDPQLGTVPKDWEIRRTSP